jgi:LPXTG-motif cell wall-anchored protein
VKKAKGIFSLVHIRESEVRKMTIKYSKGLAIAGVLVLSAMMVPPAQAEDPVVPVATTSAITTGTIHIIQNVINDDGGVALPSDFVITVKHFAANVAGSPIAGVGGAGNTFVLEPGTYVVAQEPKEGYYGAWNSAGDHSGFINLQAGQVITLLRTSNDAHGAFAVAAPATGPVTETGGTLPTTSSPWFNLLGVGTLIGFAGVFGVRRSRVSSK